jgi:Fic family protein
MLEPAPIIEKCLSESCVALILKLEMNGELQKIQNDYLYWDKIKYKAKSQNIAPKALWEAVKLFRSSRKQNINFQRYNFHYVMSDYMQKTLHQFDRHIGGNLGSKTSIAETDKPNYLVNSIIEEAIASSQMEGASTTRKKAKAMIVLEQKPKDKSEQMILNNYATMQYIVQHKNDDLTPENLLHIHQLVSLNTLEKPTEEGQWRDNNEIYVVNYSTSEVAHTPPEASELKALINDLCFFFNEESEVFVHPIIKACVVHFMIGWIHPFTDGNGRTARALFYWYMLKKGYWLTEYLSISKIIQESKMQYEKAYLYTEIDENDLSYFITYHLKAMEKAFEALKVYVDKKQKEVFEATKFMKIPGVNERMAQILKLIYDDGHKILNSKSIESKFGVSNYTARNDLKALVRLGFLSIIQVNKQKQNFIKSADFDKVLKSYDL